MKRLLALLKPARTVPTMPWANGESNWRTNPLTFVILISGLWIFGIGEAALIAAGIGVSPWVVFQQGLSLNFGWSIGWSTFIVSAFVLLLWIPLKRKPGLGTVSNMIVIALSIEVMLPLLPEPKTMISQLALTLGGIGLTGLASAIYITCNLGTGPRDGLMTGLHYLTGVRISRVRMSIEATVLIAGWLLGGTVGLGTVLFMIGIGHSVAIWFGVFDRVFAKRV